MKFTLVALSAIFLAGCNCTAGALTGLQKDYQGLKGVLAPEPKSLLNIESAFGPPKVYYPPPQLAK